MSRSDSGGDSKSWNLWKSWFHLSLVLNAGKLPEGYEPENWVFIYPDTLV
jgi:hypothetical protein